MTRPTALGLLFITALLWSTGGLLIKSVEWNPLAIAGTRSAIAACLLLVIFRNLRFRRSFDQWGGAVAYASTVILFVAANKLTTAANAILLQYTAPVYVAFFGARFLGEPASRLDWIAILIAFLGMGLFFFDELTARNMFGNVVAIASGFSFAWLTLFMRKQKDSSGLESIVLGNIIAAVVCSPWMFSSLPSPTSWVYLAVLGVGQLTLPYILYAMATKHVTALDAIMVPFIEPILNPLWVLLFLGERPGPMALVGGAVILGAVLLRVGGPWLTHKLSYS